MNRAVATIRVFPLNVDVDLNVLVEKLREKLPVEAELYTYRKEPIAFGIEALILDIILPEENMGELLDYIEESFKKIDSVGEVEVILTRRI